jgi:arsenate reductase-like glutaredoxin family protein
MNISIDLPFRLNFNKLDRETQENLVEQSKQEVERKFGENLKTYAAENYLDYDSLLEEEAIKNLYNHKFKLTI